MATISVEQHGSEYRVAISGTLAARDLKHLEHACREALRHERVPLELDVIRVTSMDDAARTYLDRLKARGARLCQAPASDASVGS